MSMKKVNFPYPVLSKETDDYVRGAFDVSISTEEREGKKYVVLYSSLSEEGLIRLIDRGQAKFSYRVLCSSTYVNERYFTSETELKIPLDGETLYKKLSIIPQIVATGEIEEYTSPNFHPDYRGITFRLEKSVVLATHPSIDLLITQEETHLDQESIFSIVKNQEEKEKWLLRLHQDKIVILLPEALYDYVQRANHNEATQILLKAELIAPVIVEVLSKLSIAQELGQFEGEDGLDAFEEYDWFNTMKNKLKTALGVDLESDNLRELCLNDLAQRLIGHPMSEHLVSSFEREEEE